MRLDVRARTGRQIPEQSFRGQSFRAFSRDYAVKACIRCIVLPDSINHRTRQDREPTAPLAMNGGRRQRQLIDARMKHLTAYSLAEMEGAAAGIRVIEQ